MTESVSSIRFSITFGLNEVDDNRETWIHDVNCLPIQTLGADKSGSTFLYVLDGLDRNNGKRNPPKNGLHSSEFGRQRG